MKSGKLVLVLAFFLGACATSPRNITPQYVSPMMYTHLSCDQMRAEMQRVGARVETVTGQQQRAADSDTLAMGVGLVLFWPALFFLANDNDKREELSRLMGEYEALQQAGNMNSCFASPAPAAAPPAIAPPAESNERSPTTGGS